MELFISILILIGQLYLVAYYPFMQFKDGNSRMGHYVLLGLPLFIFNSILFFAI